MITLIHGIYLRNQQVLVKDANNHLVPLHRRQGDLDGACAVYSTIMCMLHIGYLSEDDLRLYNSPDKRTAKGKILHELMENNGLIRNGFSYIRLKKELDDKCGCDIVVARRNPKNQDDIVANIADLIDNDIAPIISIEWNDGAHALLAIGYETDDDETITNILCLDSDAESPKVCAWNCYIDVSKESGEMPYKYVSTSNKGYKVKLGDYLTLQKRDSMNSSASQVKA